MSSPVECHRGAPDPNPEPSRSEAQQARTPSRWASQADSPFGFPRVATRSQVMVSTSMTDAPLAAGEAFMSPLGLSFRPSRSATCSSRLQGGRRKVLLECVCRNPLEQEDAHVSTRPALAKLGGAACPGGQDSRSSSPRRLPHHAAWRPVPTLRVRRTSRLRMRRPTMPLRLRYPLRAKSHWSPSVEAIPVCRPEPSCRRLRQWKSARLLLAGCQR